MSDHTLAANAVLVIGASSGIAGALMAEVQAASPHNKVIAVSRSRPEGELAASFESADSTAWLSCDYSEDAMQQVIAQAQETLNDWGATLVKIVICNGRLHDAAFAPEKRIEELSGETLHSVFDSNAVIPALWLKALKPLLRDQFRGDKKHREPLAVAVLSARIGSITENGKGGWYAYRASKSALNMLLKTSAIEYQRSLPGLRFIAFHPGTTDTPLSEPFQRSVPEGKLFTPKYVAQCLLQRLDEAAAEADGQARFVAYDGSTIPW